MALTEMIAPREAEAERVVGWRLEELERAGYSRPEAHTLAERTDVDLHLAVALTRRGCSPQTALKILL